MWWKILTIISSLIAALLGIRDSGILDKNEITPVDPVKVETPVKVSFIARKHVIMFASQTSDSASDRPVWTLSNKITVGYMLPAKPSYCANFRVLRANLRHITTVCAGRRPHAGPWRQNSVYLM